MTLRPPFPSLRYATVAKKVDVRALKRQLWAEIEPPHAAAPAPAAARADATPRPFSELMGSVARQRADAAAAAGARDGASVAFYFICVLHLANEKGLTLEPSGDALGVGGGGGLHDEAGLRADFVVRRDPDVLAATAAAAAT